MELKDKTITVTGGASGIGKAMAIRFAEEGARVVVADLAEEKARRTAEKIQGLAVACDVTKEADIQNLVRQTEHEIGPLDMFCSNAGIGFGEPDLVTSASNAQWQTSWEVHVMAHVYAARAALPGMIARGSGYFLQTVSAAGLLNQIGAGRLFNHQTCGTGLRRGAGDHPWRRRHQGLRHLPAICRNADAGLRGRS